MYRIDAATNSILPLTAHTFGDLGFKERRHLQEWIAKAPDCLGEELLIIQKEFAGFADTKERLDLLALDKQGSLVLIENKLDDTGRDVTWQALKYASYCSGLTKDQIANVYQDHLNDLRSAADARAKIVEFLEAEDWEDVALNSSITQRIMLVAASFRKEVTSTVLWLLNYKLRIQCFRVTPFSMGEQHFLNVEQIIPIRDAEEFMIGIAAKVRDEFEEVTSEKNRHKSRREFWAEVLKAFAPRSSLFQNISPGTSNWISAGSGVASVSFNFVASRTYARVELWISRPDAAQNKLIFDELLRQKEAIETAFGHELVWERLDENKASRIKYEAPGNMFDREQWPDMIAFMVDGMLRMERTFKEPLAQINPKLKHKG